jgi:hypothetical protein
MTTETGSYVVGFFAGRPATVAIAAFQGAEIRHTIELMTSRPHRPSTARPGWQVATDSRTALLRHYASDH